MIPHISLAWWLVGALAIVIIWIFEASFQITATRDTKISELSAALTGRRVRVLLDEQISQLVSEFQKLKASLPSVAIAITNGDHETEQYAYALRNTFHRAGIQTEFGFTVPDGPGDTGVLICLKNPESPPPEAKILKSALRQARIETKTRPFTKDGMHVSGETRDWQMVLWVAPQPL